MKNYQIKESINKVAKENHLPKNTVLDEMQKALDAAWESKEPEAMKKQQELFPSGKPSVEEFIKRIAELSKGQ